MNPYMVEIDGIREEIRAESLAHLANLVRGRAKHRVKVWSPVGIMLIDTLYGDAYALIPVGK